MMYRIGVDLGGTNIAVGLVDENWSIVGTASTPTRPENGAAGVVRDIAQTIQNTLIFGGVSISDCAGIGVGSPGNCDSAGGIVRNAHNLNWDSVPLCAMLETAAGLPARLANDGDCAALGEVVAGAAKGSGSALLVTLGTGVGAGLILDGKIRSGHRSLGGEFGHMCIQMGGEACTCGQKGCWEAYASATALIRQARRAAAEHPESALNAAAKLDGRSIYAAAEAGDATAREITARYAEYVGVGLVNLVNALFPEVILLGGGVAGAGEALFGPVREFVSRNLFVGDPALCPPILPAALGNDAGIIGAAALWK